MSLAQDRKTYAAKGYVDMQDMLSRGLAETARAELDALFQRFPDNTAAKLTIYDPAGLDAGQARIDNPHLVSPAVNRILQDSAIGPRVAALLGVKAVQVWYCHALRKPAGVSAANHVGWHQDGQYAAFLRGAFVTAWIPLLDITPDSSPLIYVAGSHLHGLVKGSGFSHKASLLELKQDILRHHPVPWNEEQVMGRMGFVSFHDSRLIHGSAANDGPRVRYSIACHLRTEDNLLLPEFDYKNAVAQIRDTTLSPVIHGSVDQLDFGRVMQ